MTTETRADDKVELASQDVRRAISRAAAIFLQGQAFPDEPLPETFWYALGRLQQASRLLIGADLCLAVHENWAYVDVRGDLPYGDGDIAIQALGDIELMNEFLGGVVALCRNLPGSKTGGPSCQ